MIHVLIGSYGHFHLLVRSVYMEAGLAICPAFSFTVS